MQGATTRSNVFLDCETHRITRENPIPPIVCLQFARNNDQPQLLGGTQEGKDKARALFQSWLVDPNTVLVAHNGFFDATRLLDLDGYWLPINGNSQSHETAILLWMTLCLTGRYRDTLVMAKLNSIEYDWMAFDRKMWSKAEYNLAYLVKRFTGHQMVGKEKDAWRLNYHLLDNQEPNTWPATARDYALGDITHLRNLFNCLDKNSYPDEAFQTAAYWVFRLMEVWGLHTNRDRVEYLKSRVLPFIEEANTVLLDQGLMRPGEWKTDTEKFEAYLVALCQSKGIPVPRTATGKVSKTAKFLASLNSPLVFDKRAWQEQQPPTRDMHKIKEIVVDWYSSRGLDVPLVDKPHGNQEEEVDYFTGNPDDEPETDPTEGVSTDRDCLLSTDHPGLKILGEVGKLKTLANNFIPKMETGYEHPLRAFWNGLVITGRPSCSAGEFGTNFLNQPKEIRENEHGVRECYQARAGYVFIDADAQQAELCGFAQICHDKFGYSVMGDIINSGKDLHVWFGAILAGLPYDHIMAGYKAKDHVCTMWRSMAKPCNFGFLGGLGAKKFVKWARKQYKINFTEKQVKEYKKLWLQEFPEAQEYFNWVNCQIRAGHNERFTFIQHRSNRARGGCGFCDGANCLDSETEALTKRGWIKGFDLRLDDYLLTKNPGSGSFEWHRPSRLNLFPDYDGPVIEFKTKSIHAVTTPAHRWLVTNKTGKVTETTTEAMSKHGDHRVHRTGLYKEPASNAFSLDMIRLLGWFLTDGYVKVYKGGRTIRLCQSSTGNPHKVKLIDELWNTLEVKGSRSLTKSGLVVWTMSTKDVRLGALLSAAPERVLTSEFIISLSQAQAEVLVNTMMLGDGDIRGNLVCRDIIRADAFQMLVTIAGKHAIVRRRDNLGIRYSSKIATGSIETKNPYWLVTVKSRTTAQVLGSQRTTRYGKVPVWCPTVKNSFFVVRRSGTVYVTGNTGFQGIIADAVKKAMILIFIACHTPGDALYGCRVALQIYDEMLLEAPVRTASAASARFVQLFQEGMNQYLPNVPAKVTCEMMVNWSKLAKAVFNSKNKMVPFDISKEEQEDFGR